jgi:uncharacterized protein YbjQ (UPF0145 family)
MCGSSSLYDAMPEEEVERRRMRAEEEDAALKEEIMNRAKTMKVFTIQAPISVTVSEEIGLVFGNSSKQAFWGLSTQANRLSRAYEDALLGMKYDAATMGADAVLGVHFALNNSTGSSSKIAGSSEAVMLLGTAVKLK